MKKSLLVFSLVVFLFIGLSGGSTAHARAIKTPNASQVPCTTNDLFVVNYEDSNGTVQAACFTGIGQVNLPPLSLTILSFFTGNWYAKVTFYTFPEGITTTTTFSPHQTWTESPMGSYPTTIELLHTA